MSARQRVAKTTRPPRKAPQSPFLAPADQALQAAMSIRDDGIDVANASEVMPSFESGREREIESLAMNEVLADAEIRFDNIYLPYPRHTQMQLKIDQVRLHGTKAKGAPMRGLRILGPTGSGKTTGIKEYAAHLQGTGRYTDKQIPLVHVRLRKKATWHKVLRAILQKFGERYALKRDEDELNEQARNSIKRGGVEVLVIDECQHLKNMSTDSLVVTDELKVFLDDSIVPVIFVGTYDAKVMFEENLELSGRLGDPVDLAPLVLSDPGDMNLFVGFLKHLDAAMVREGLVSKISKLDRDDIAECLHIASGGVIGQTFRLVRAAMLIATSREATHVEPYDLALAVDRWAIPNRVCRANPFRTSVLSVSS